MGRAGPRKTSLRHASASRPPHGPVCVATRDLTDRRPLCRAASGATLRAATLARRFLRASGRFRLPPLRIRHPGRAQEPYATFDQAAERIEKRLRRYHSRLKSHHDGHAHELAPSYVIEAPDQEKDAPSEFSPAIIAESTTKLRRMAVSDAVLDLDLTGAPVVIFRHAQSGRVNIVYRRADDNIGWIDPPTAE